MQRFRFILIAFVFVLSLAAAGIGEPTGKSIGYSATDFIGTWWHKAEAFPALYFKITFRSNCIGSAGMIFLGQRAKLLWAGLGVGV